MKKLLLVFLLLNFVMAMPLSAQRYKNASPFHKEDIGDEPFNGLRTLVQSKEIWTAIDFGDSVSFVVSDYLGANQLQKTESNHFSFSDPSSRRPVSHMDATIADLMGDGNKAIIQLSEVENQSIQLLKTTVNPDNLKSSTVSLGTLNGVLSNSDQGYDLPKMKIKVVQLDDDDADELVVAYLSKSGGFVINNFKTTQSGSLVNIFQNNTHLDFLSFDIHVADLDLNGRDELILFYEEKSNGSLLKNLFVEVFECNSSSRAWRSASKIKILENVDVENSMRLAVTSGDFNGDLVPEIAVLTGTGLRMPADIFVIEAQDDSITEKVNYLEHLEITTSIFSYVMQGNQDGHVNIETGDLDGDSRDELVFGVYKNNTNNFYINALWMNEEGELENTANSNSFYYSNNGYTSMPRQFIQVADLNGDNVEEVAFYSFDYVYDSGLSSKFVQKILGFPNKNLQWNEIASISHNIQPNKGKHHPFSILAVDLDKDEVTIGKPKYFEKTEIQRPLVVLNAPPTHFDVLNHTLYDVNTCYSGDNDCGFYASYTKENTLNQFAETSIHADWGVSKSAEAEVSTPWTSVEGSITNSYGEGFSSFSSNGITISITQGNKAVVDDELYATVLNYAIYEYPMYKGDHLIGHLMSIKPKVVQNAWFPSLSNMASEFYPSHEVGNILSYKEYVDDSNNAKIDLSKNNRVDEALAISASAITLDNSGESIWSVNFENITSFGGERTKHSGEEVSASASVGGSFLGFGGSLTVDVDGYYSSEQISTQTTTISEGIEVQVQLGSINQGIGEVLYSVTPYMYWNKAGTLVIDYAVKPEVPVLGGTETWWSRNYGKEQDPAFILPWRYYEEKGNKLEEQARRYQSKSIFFSTTDAEPGDTITVYADINNWSLIPTDGFVDVSFYNGDPNNGGVLLTNTDGKSLITTSGSIPARGNELVSFEWEIPDNVGRFPRIYAYIDPSDDMNEIHETNNIGWNILNVEGIPTSIDEEPAATNNEELLTAAPNPTTGQSIISFGLKQSSDVYLSLYNLQGSLLNQIKYNNLSKGQHQHIFDLSEYPQGVYIVSLTMDDHREALRLVKF